MLCMIFNTSLFLDHCCLYFKINRNSDKHNFHFFFFLNLLTSVSKVFIHKYGGTYLPVYSTLMKYLTRTSYDGDTMVLFKMSDQGPTKMSDPSLDVLFHIRASYQGFIYLSRWMLHQIYITVVDIYYFTLYLSINY